MKDRLLEHIGHEVEIASYADDESVTLECIDCGVVILAAEDWDGED